MPSLETSNARLSTGVIWRAIALIAAFLLLSVDYLFVYFSSNDLLNLQQSLGQGWRLARGLVFFWSSEFYRPVGGLLYLGLYSLFGLHSTPFQLVMLLVLTVNLVIAWRVGTLLLKDSRLAALAVLLVLYHASLPGDLWYNFGNFATIYDVVCFTFMYSAFCVWLQIRSANRFPGVTAIFVIAALQILALGAKEMVVALPVLMLLRELFWGGLVRRTRPWIEWRALPAIGVLAWIAAVFLAGKSQGAYSILNNPAYQTTYTLSAYLHNMSRYLSQLCYSGDFARPGLTAWFLGGGLALAAVLRARVMAFGWLWFLVSALPVAFIPARAGSVLYIPALGLAVGLADYLGRLYQVAERLFPSPRWRHLDPAGAPVFALALASLMPVHWHQKQLGDAAGKHAALQNRDFAADLARAGPSRRGASLLYLRDPFEADGFDPVFLSSLLLDDRQLKVGRVKTNQVLLSPALMAQFDDVYDFDRGHLQRIPKADIPERTERLRAESGYADPGSGIYVTLDPRWWAGKDFVLTVHCPAKEAQCRLALELLVPSPPVSPSEVRTVSLDLPSGHGPDLRLAPSFNPQPFEFPMPASGGVIPLRFHVDPAIPQSLLNGDERPLAVIVSGVDVR
ncbi:MAG: hypothetical protein LAP40_06175 [Acidobacteriia bacterium]|nr:hypothetical protein [Terriglobia bacterium]